MPVSNHVAVAVAMLLTGARASAEAVAPIPLLTSPAPAIDQAAQSPIVSGGPETPASPPLPTSPLPPAPAADPSDIVVTARPRSPGDPLQHLNAKSFEATQSVDRAVVGPVALAYQHKVPGPIRIGLRNALKNLHEPVVFLNFLLQHKVGKAGETFGRFAINSTIGAVGLIDIAKRRPFSLPRRPNGLADTLGFYGVKPGPFFFLPLVGPTTLRDFIGNGIDGLLLPTAIGKPFNRLSYTVPTGVLRSLDHRAEFDEQLNKLRNESSDPYIAAREYYLQQRQAEIDALHVKRVARRASAPNAGAGVVALPEPVLPH